jgi:hypothetical protein
MSRIVIFDEGASPERVITVIRRGDPALYRERTDWVENPDLSALEGIVLQKYWKHSGGAIVEYTQVEKDTQDAAELAAHTAFVRESAKAQLDNFLTGSLFMRALADVIKDEINILRAQHLLADRTLAQLKTAIKDRIDDGTVDS